MGRDGVRRTTAHPRHAGSRAGSEGGSLVFDLELEPRGAIDLVVDFEVSERIDGEVAAASRAGATRDAPS